MQGVKCPSRGVGEGQGRAKLGLLTADASGVGIHPAGRTPPCQRWPVTTCHCSQWEFPLPASI